MVFKDSKSTAQALIEENEKHLLEALKIVEDPTNSNQPKKYVSPFAVHPSMAITAGTKEKVSNLEVLEKLLKLCDEGLRGDCDCEIDCNCKNCECHNFHVTTFDDILKQYIEMKYQNVYQQEKTEKKTETDQDNSAEDSETETESEDCLCEGECTCETEDGDDSEDEDEVENNIPQFNININ